MKFKTKRYYKEQNDLLKLEILKLDKKSVELKELYDDASETIEMLKTSLKTALKGHKTANRTMTNYIAQNKQLKIEVEALQNKLIEKEKQRKVCAGKIGGYVKENHKLSLQITELNDKINALEEEKAQCWILKKLPSEKTPNTQKLRIKSSSRQSNIMKNLQKAANNEN